MEACSPNTGTVLDPFSDHGTRECWELGFAEAYRPENLWSFFLSVPYHVFTEKKKLHYREGHYN